jgi:RNA polymerase sigma factor (sigma-70 family)
MDVPEVGLLELAERLRDGDHRMSAKIFERVYPRHVQLARYMLRDFPRVERRYLPEDVVHQAWIDLETALKSVTPNTPREYLGLLARKMRQVLLDFAKKESGKSTMSPLFAGELGPDGSTIAYEPEAGLSRDPGRVEIWSKFHEAVGELPDDVREPFELYFYTEVQPSYAQIARVLGLSESKVKRLIAKARDQLSRRVSGLGELLD